MFRANYIFSSGMHIQAISLKIQEEIKHELHLTLYGSFQLLIKHTFIWLYSGNHHPSTFTQHYPNLHIKA